MYLGFLRCISSQSDVFTFSSMYFPSTPMYPPFPRCIYPQLRCIHLFLDVFPLNSDVSTFSSMYFPSIPMYPPFPRCISPQSRCILPLLLAIILYFSQNEFPHNKKDAEFPIHASSVYRFPIPSESIPLYPESLSCERSPFERLLRGTKTKKYMRLDKSRQRTNPKN